MPVSRAFLYISFRFPSKETFPLDSPSRAAIERRSVSTANRNAEQWEMSVRSRPIQGIANREEKKTALRKNTGQSKCQAETDSIKFQSYVLNSQSLQHCPYRCWVVLSTSEHRSCHGMSRRMQASSARRGDKTHAMWPWLCACQKTNHVFNNTHITLKYQRYY